MQENDDAISEMSRENYDVLRKMMEYISSFSISLFEKEVLRKDLIGICLEADRENQAVLDKMGVSLKEFCDTLRKDCLASSFFEQVIIPARNMFLWLFAVFSIVFIDAGFSNNCGLGIEWVIFALLCSFIQDWVAKIRWRGTFYEMRKKRKYYVVSLVIDVAVTLCFFTITDGIVLFYGHGRLVWCVLLVLAATTFFGNNYYWNKVSRQYNWE